MDTPGGSEDQVRDELTQRLERLEAAVREVSGRLAALERAGPRAAPVPPPPPPLTPHREPPAPPRMTPPAPVPVARPEPPPLRRPEPKPKAEMPAGWETEIALKWMGWVGAVALICAAIYFAVYAVQNGLIGPTGQVVILILAGLGLIGTGDSQLRRARRALGESLMGAGVAMLYVAIYAAFALYKPALLGYSAAFTSLILVAAFAAAIAVRGNAQSTAVLAALGGFLTPVMVRQPGAGADELATMIRLFSYLTILDLGLLALVYYKQWRTLQVLAFLGSWFILWGWLADVQSKEIRYYSMAPAAVFFLIFLLVPVVRNLRLKHGTRPEELGLVLVNPACFFPTLAALAAIYYPDYLGLLAVVLAGVYLALGQTAWRRNPDDKLLSLSWLSLGLVLITIAIPLQFQGQWIMLAWGVEGTLLVWIGFRLQARVVRYLGLVLQLVVMAWLFILYEVADPHPDAKAWFLLNSWFLSYLGGMATLAVTLWQHRRVRQPDGEIHGAGEVFGVALALLAWWGVLQELLRLDMPTHVHLTWLVVIGVAVTQAAFRARSAPLRVVGLIFQAASVVWLLLLYSLHPRALWLKDQVPLINEVFIVFALGLGGLGLTLARYVSPTEKAPERGAMAPVLAVIIALLGLWGLTADVDSGLRLLVQDVPGRYSLTGFVLSLLWCLYAAGLVSYGISRRHVPLRTVGLLVFALAVLKVFLWDSQQLEKVWRILSFVCLGIILIAVSYLYHLHGERIRSLLAGEPPEAPEEGTDEPPDTPA